MADSRINGGARQRGRISDAELAWIKTVRRREAEKAERDARRQAKLLPPTAYGYVRVSTEEQAKGHEKSPENQRARILAYYELTKKIIEMEGGKPPVWGGYFEDHHSAFKHLEKSDLFSRPAGKKLRDALRPGDYVIADSVDRCFRQVADGSFFLRYCLKNKIQLMFVRERIDMSGLGGRAAYYALLMTAELESHVRSERAKAKYRQCERLGLPIPNNRSRLLWRKRIVGNKKIYELLPGSEALLAKIVRLRDEDGLAFVAIAKRLMKEDWPSITDGSKNFPLFHPRYVQVMYDFAKGLLAKGGKITTEPAEKPADVIVQPPQVIPLPKHDAPLYRYEGPVDETIQDPNAPYF